jgi:hypothetical protein
MFEGKARAYLSEALFRCSSLDQAPKSLVHYTRLERPARRKLRTLQVIYEH